MCEEFRENFKGYHVNDKERCLKFISDKSYIIISDDRCWLGKGMYFWDNESNAIYWKKEKDRKNPGVENIIVNSNIYINDEILLDLTDEDVVNDLNDLWKAYCEKSGEKMNQPLGLKLDKLFDFFDELNELKVIKCIGDYDIDRKNINYFIQRKNFNGPQVRGRLKTIYCIKDESVAVNRKVRCIL
ncbi:hypothetical protein [Clostridium paraputrificum]|uniref:hypothetical protein n=1 Tax=Clostridium paraputrificum TaxID=29363 RepID=UPI00040C44C2|nr:hypothetical protein [Clostridium paraputrificum]